MSNKIMLDIRTHNCYNGITNSRLEGAIMEKKEIRDIILESMVESLEAQARALKKLRGSPDADKPREKSMSQVGIVLNILTKARKPLHVSTIIADAERMFGVKLERESLVSALSKKVMKGDRFVRTGKNTFALKAER